MHLLHENGFSSGERCLVFDHICRRTRRAWEHSGFFVVTKKSFNLDSFRLHHIEELAIEVESRYTDYYSRLYKRKPVILQIPRKCSSCQGRILDDAFPYFAKIKQDMYIVRTLQLKRCGLPGCTGSINLCPFDEWQDHVNPNRGPSLCYPNSNIQALQQK